MRSNNAKLAKTSNTPGKKQLINHYNIESATKSQKNKTNWFLVDLPGYGYAKRSQQQRKEWSRMIEDYLRKRNTLINIFILIDVRHEPQKIDLEFVDDLGNWKLPFTIVFTKADKEKPGAVERNVKLFFEKMRESWQFLPRYFVTSAITKQGKEEILDLIDDCNKEFQQNEKSI